MNCCLNRAIIYCYCYKYYRIQFSANEEESFKDQCYSSYEAINVNKDWTEDVPQFAMSQINVNNLINTIADLPIDAIIYQECSQESWLMLAHKFNAPIVVIGRPNRIN